MNEISLSELKPKQNGVVIRIDGDSNFRKRLMDMGVTRGAKIRMIRNAPLGDPIEFEVRGYKITLRKKEIKGVYLKTDK
jgi:Fe2+ transport system protein FeoA